MNTDKGKEQRQIDPCIKRYTSGDFCSICCPGWAHRNGEFTLAFSPGTILASVAGNTTLKLWVVNSQASRICSAWTKSSQSI